MPNDDDKSLAAWAAQGAMDEAPAAVIAPVIVTEVPETPTEPVIEPVISEIVADPEAPPAEIIPDPKPAGATPAKKPTPLPPWMQVRLAEQTAKQREAERQAQEAVARAQVAEAELATLRQRAANPDAAPVVDPARVDPRQAPAGFVPESEVEARAERKASERAFNAQADAAYYAGKESYADFDDALKPLHAIDALGRRDFQEAALATEAAPDVLYYLGCNPDEASKILGDLKAGNTAKATAQMTKIALTVGAQKEAAKKAAAPKPSNAPAPIRPVGGSALPVVELEKLSDDDFTAEFDKKAKAAGWY